MCFDLLPLRKKGELGKVSGRKHLNAFSAWLLAGIAIGLVGGLFSYQSRPPRFRSTAVLELSGLMSGDAEAHAVTVYRAHLLSEQTTGSALSLLNADYDQLVDQLPSTLPSESTIRLGFNDASLELAAEGSHFAGTAQNGMKFRLTCESVLPSRTSNILESWLLGSQHSANEAEPTESELDPIQTIMLLKTTSEARIAELRGKLIGMPLDQESRWEPGVGLVSASKVEWDQMQREAERLHERKAVLNEQLIRLKSQNVQKDTIPLSQGNAVSEGENPSNGNRVEQIDYPNANQREVSQGAFTTADKINYLKSEMDLIFESHLELSQKLRVLARKIDLEEQVAFEESVVRKELEQELQIRDQLLARVNSPSSAESRSSRIQVRILTQPSPPTQFAPVLLLHLGMGSVVGGGLMGMVSLFVFLVGIEDEVGTS